MSPTAASDEQIARAIITMGMGLLLDASKNGELCAGVSPQDLTDHDLRECTAMLRASRSLLVLEADQLRRALATTHHRIESLFYPLLLRPIPPPPPALERYVPDGRGGEVEVTRLGDD